MIELASPGPGISAITGAGFFQAQAPIQAQAVPTVLESPLPGGVATVVRFLFNLPQWVQITALGVGALAALAVLVLLWLRRAALLGWLRARSRPVALALVAGAALAVVAAAGGSAVAWHYTQHDNGFCTGCHVMGPAYARFTRSQHAKLECHACHQQSIFASMRQVYLWVAERPERIGPHAKVPTQVCAGCHLRGDPQKWKQISATAGHRTHLESDSSALRGIQCVTCHGVEVHQFAPVNKTCAQAGCHEDASMALGKMQSQTSLHCVACHQFTAPVPALATRDSAAGTLRPGERQCLGCHQMRQVLPDFDAARDPHRGTCGMCHNPHRQRVAADAAKTCGTAQCHAGWRGNPFHTGLKHRDVGANCTLCHEPHQARVDPSDCGGCHARIAKRPDVSPAIRARLRAAQPFDTARVLRQTLLVPSRGTEARLGGCGLRLVDCELKGRLSQSTIRRPRSAIGNPQSEIRYHGPSPPDWTADVPVLQDTFPHARHSKLACLTCHTARSGHGGLTFERPRGCDICHHQEPAKANCATCHPAATLAPPVRETVTVTVAGAPSREHGAGFDHAAHAAVKCVDCHTTPVTLAPAVGVRTCSSCHADHHAAQRTCATCHSGEGLQTAHRPGLSTHVACDACHSSATVARLVPDRWLCLTCHLPQRDHYAARECTVCHFQETPAAFRRRLLQGGEPS